MPAFMRLLQGKRKHSLKRQAQNNDKPSQQCRQPHLKPYSQHHVNIEFHTITQQSHQNHLLGDLHEVVVVHQGDPRPDQDPIPHERHCPDHAHVLLAFHADPIMP